MFRTKLGTTALAIAAMASLGAMYGCEQEPATTTPPATGTEAPATDGTTTPPATDGAAGGAGAAGEAGGTP